MSTAKNVLQTLCDELSTVLQRHNCDDSVCWLRLAPLLLFVQRGGLVMACT